MLRLMEYLLAVTMAYMTRKKTSVYADEELLRGVKVLAARSGKTNSDVMEEALRRLLGVEVLEQVWASNHLKPEQAEELATDVVREARRRR